MNRLFLALTGRHAIAQGNALGIWPPDFSSPERAEWFSWSRMIRSEMFRPFRTRFHFALVPRALPWAFTVRPFGASNHSSVGPKGHHAIPQGATLRSWGTRPATFSRPERA